MNNKFKGSFLLKSISMVILPIVIIVFIICGFITVYTMSYPEIKSDKSFYETSSFVSMYKGNIYTKIMNVEDLELTNINNMNNLKVPISDNTQALQVQNSDIEMNPYRYSKLSIVDDISIFYENTGYKKDIFYLIEDKENKKAYTNVSKTSKTDSLEKIKTYILNGKRNWSVEKNVIKTNIEKLSMEEWDYNDVYEDSITKLNGRSMYTSFNDSAIVENGVVSEEYIFNIVSDTYQYAYALFPILIILIVIISAYLISSCGHKSNTEEIHLDWLDKLSLEVYGTIAIIILCIEFGVMSILGIGEGRTYNFEGVIYFSIIGIYFIIISSAYIFGGILKRIKSKTLIKNTIIYKLCRWIKFKIQAICEEITYNFNSTLKIALIYGVFILISLLLILMSRNGMFAIILMIFWIWFFTVVLKIVKQFNMVKDALRNIYEGKTDIHLNENELKGVLKEMANYINDIAGGFSNAVQESLKSERLKTELITNVSHDIKTPLTSIINYVDLLKKEDFQDEKVKEYLEVLDNKSQRLKKLIEDLVEASKASSGNMKLNMEKLNIKELINQITGEFSDKFNKKGLTVIMNLPKEDVIIVADNRYLYRVMENLYSNIAKYTLDDSRVYIDVITNAGKAIISVKNISKDQLNISVDELMERFVRGDVSRNTEGSGLGLSIARSLTELQGGKFDIYLDGDLFKVVLEF